MSNYIPDLTKSPLTLLTELFLFENPNLTEHALTFAPPQEINVGTASTKVLLTIPSIDADVNSAYITYQRISLTKLFEQISCGVLSSNFTDGTTDISTIKDEVLHQYGLNISDGFTVVKEGDKCYLTANSNNLAYVHRVELVPTLALRDRVKVTLLDGFEITKFTPAFKFQIGTWSVNGRPYVGYNVDPNWSDNGGRIDDPKVWKVNTDTLVDLKSIKVDAKFNMVIFRSKTEDKWLDLDHLTLTLIDDKGKFIAIPLKYWTNGIETFYRENYAMESDGAKVTQWLLAHEDQYVTVDVNI